MIKNEDMRMMLVMLWRRRGGCAGSRTDIASRNASGISAHANTVLRIEGIIRERQLLSVLRRSTWSGVNSRVAGCDGAKRLRWPHFPTGGIEFQHRFMESADGWSGRAPISIGLEQRP